VADQQIKRVHLHLHLRFLSLHDQKIKKKNFTEGELEVLLSEVEARKNVLFGTLSSGISNKLKRGVGGRAWARRSEKRTQAEVKKEVVRY